jgi:hypothetical protein
VELVVFAALAWFAAAHWADGLVADAPGGRVAAAVGVALAAAVALTLAQGIRSRAARAAACAGASLAALGGGWVAIGLDRHLLAPGRWDDFADGLDRGFAALGAVEWPYSGPEPWSRLALLLAIPPVLTAAAALAFWPGRRRLRPVGLVLLVGLYGLAVTEHRFDGELLRGAALLVLVAAWLWLPQLPRQGLRAGLVAVAAVAGACLLALPAAARYEDRQPWVDYESWNPFHAQAATRFDWSHSYGPIDWPRDGTTMMNVRSRERHYWRVETLDRFDGVRWVRSGAGRGENPLLPDPYRPEWESTFRVTIRDLDTDLMPSAGTALEVRGADPVVVPSVDGTLAATVDSLDAGDSYEVRAFVPDPSPRQMRAAPVEPGTRVPQVPVELLGYTTVHLPSPAGVPVTSAQILDSPYRGVLALARRLARGQETPYDVVRAVQRHLRSEYEYDEHPPRREYPLAAFLFEHRTGYCQQFSGAMALMLRMLGIPARVAAGFSPGSYNRKTGEYRVRDLDAHSWVEVWFTGVGWVPFDPTPSVAPAEFQSAADAPSAAGGPRGGGETPDPVGGGGLSGTGGASPGGGPDNPAAVGWRIAAGLAAAALLAAAAAGLSGRVRRRRRTVPDDHELAVLRRAFARARRPLPATMTLRRLELALAAAGRPAGAAYVRRLRGRRYGREEARRPAPGIRERWELHRALRGLDPVETAYVPSRR